jgi:hypothetical protein
MQFKSITAIAVLSLVVASLSVAGCIQTTNQTSPTPVAEESFLQYNNSTAGISIKYPKDWKVNETPIVDDVVRFEAPGMSSILDVAKVNQSRWGSSATPESITPSIIEGLKQANQEFTLLENTTTTFAGMPAHKIVFTFRGSTTGTITKASEVYTIKNGSLYSVIPQNVADKYDSYVGIGQQMIDSFEIK